MHMPHEQIHAGCWRPKSLQQLAAEKTLTTYEYFETFLETVRGFPVVAQTLSTYYNTLPTLLSAIAQHTIATLFPHLKAQHAFMMTISIINSRTWATTHQR